MSALRRVGFCLCLLGLLAGAAGVAAQTPTANSPTKSAAAPKAKPAATQKNVKAAPANKKPPAKASHKKAAPAPLHGTKVDLRLPAELVQDLKPATQDPITTPKPLLPYLFGEKPPSDSPFQLNGRLLNNEMQLQLRNDARQEIEGAAIDFEFKQ